MKTPHWSNIEGGQLNVGSTSIPRRVKYMEEVAAVSTDHPKIVALARRFENHPDRYRALFNYVHKNVAYYPDEKHTQVIRYPHATLRDKKGNCVDYSTLFSSVLARWGVPHKFRVVKFKGGKDYQHIYVITGNNIILDAVIGQRQDGTETLLNRPPSHFNEEVPFTANKDYDMNTVLLGNTRATAIDSPASARPVYVNVNTRSRRANLKARHAMMQGCGVMMQGEIVVDTRNQLLGELSAEEAAAIANTVVGLSGNACKRRCDFNYAFNKEKRKTCKCYCGSDSHCYEVGIDPANKTAGKQTQTTTPPPRTNPGQDKQQTPPPAAPKKETNLLLPLAAVAAFTML